MSFGKNQIIAHLDRIFPGLLILGKPAKERYTPLFQVPFWQCQTLQHLIRVCPNPHQLVQMTPEQLVQAFRAQNYRLGRQTAAKIITRAQMVLLPDPELVTIRSELLQHDLALLEVVQAHLAELEQRLTELVAQTPFQVWAPLKGLSAVQVASLAAAIGDPNNYNHAAQVFRRAGLVSGRNDSGNRQRKGQGKSILKVGDVYLRRALMNAVTTMLLHQPVLWRYHCKLCRKKHPGVARVATARKMVAILWATLRDQYPISLISCKGAIM
jgi:transposase